MTDQLKPLTGDDHAIAYVALCIWEEMTERHWCTHTDTPAPWAKMWEDNGTATTREHALILAYHAELLWRSLSSNEQEDNVPFDWEWIPAWLNMCVDWTGPAPVVSGGKKP